MAKTVHARTLSVQSIDYKYGKVIIPPYEVDIEFTPQEQAALESGINANMIPSAASANNPLADQQYVDDAVSEYSAHFLGTSAPGLTEQEFLEWADSLEKDNNDYCNWLTTDTDNKTIYKRYRYNGTQWLYEYDVADPTSIPTALSQLTDDATHRLVTDTEKTTWNGKANADEMSVVDGTGADADKVTITLKSGTSAQVLRQHQDISRKADIGQATDAKTVDSLYGAKAYSKDLVDTAEYNLKNLSAALAFATGTGTVNFTSNPEWKLVLVDQTNKILLGKYQDNTWYLPVDLDDLLDYIIADYGV